MNSYSLKPCNLFSTPFSKCSFPNSTNKFSPFKRNFQMKVSTGMSIQSPTASNSHDFWPYEVELQVRDYELDQFGVVNNAIYSKYCDHARISWLRKEVFRGVDATVQTGGALAITDMWLHFMAPLRGGDKFLVKLRVGKWTKSRLFIDHLILKLPTQEPIVKATATVIWLDKNYRLVRVPDNVMLEVARVHQTS